MGLMHVSLVGKFNIVTFVRHHLGEMCFMMISILVDVFFLKFDLNGGGRGRAWEAWGNTCFLDALAFS